MATSVSLKITSLSPTNNEVTTNVSYINPNATDAVLNEFATELFKHSDNTLQTVTKVKSDDITNAQGV